MKKMKCLILLNILLSNSIFSQGQPTFVLDKVTVGTSLTFINDKIKEPIAYTYDEYTWNTNLAIDITKRWRVGMQYMGLWTKKDKVSDGNYFIAGTFGQFNLIPYAEKARLYVEGSLNIGNYCTCLPDRPYLRDNLYYYGLGGGIDWAITKWVHLDLGFFNYNIINKFSEKYNYTQYIVGLDFPFRLKKNR
jgi:hypothetical protein